MQTVLMNVLLEAETQPDPLNAILNITKKKHKLNQMFSFCKFKFFKKIIILKAKFSFNN